MGNLLSQDRKAAVLTFRRRFLREKSLYAGSVRANTSLKHKVLTINHLTPESGVLLVREGVEYHIPCKVRL